MIPLLTPLFQGEWAPLGEALACSPRWPPDAIQVSHLIRDDRLLAGAIRQHARRRGVTGDDLRAAASAWS
ncbi:siderophore-iron reductase FhuF, partial [Vibrio parahaemolyticus]|nr:siderophore-iron reductase FhuF [Vibrio parahaemolyticus]